MESFGIKNIIFILLFVISFAYLFFSLRTKYRFLLVGKKENRFDKNSERIFNVIKIAFGQSKLLRDPIAGSVHFFIFWGFALFLIAVIESVLQGFYSSFSFEFLGVFYSLITLTHDAFGVLVFVSVAVALIRRFIIKVPRLQGDKEEKQDAAIVLILILIVVISMFGQNVSSMLIQRNLSAEMEVRPISFFIAKFFNTPIDSALMYYDIFWWIHIITIFTFMNYLPYSKHFHVFVSIPNVYFSKTGDKKYALKPLNLEDENETQFGVSDIEHFTWKQMLDGFACTECGRCTNACPAANTGKLLSPKKIIESIRKRTEEKAPLIISGLLENNPVAEKTLVHNYISDEELWACTTCMACVQECPVTIEHVDAIVDMRRNLVLTESEFPNELNSIFKNLETNFTPWAFNHQDRAAWAEGLNVKTMAEDSNCDLLFWVGCAGSYDARYQKVSKSFVKILQNAGVDFRILGTEEKCNGDTARRLGNEYLAQMLIQENVETLNNYKVKKIVTACPHCFNSLKNEFPQFGGNFEVIHHSQFIEELISQGKIQLKESKAEKITYHDSCYLGRYNGIYDSPRNSIKSIKNIELVEMDRNRDRGFCCGAGGGRMFLEENEGTRVNETRVSEALSKSPDTIATACPFCMTMMNDGIKTFDKNDVVNVKDISEIVLENSKY
ncbi:MAG: Fe-S oxidoreductase [Ignavibacteriales bacterium CG_4_9_14_3_um_filter_34_10]|nr:MAG: Fe-S oxidoreductase [Ignavibacteriales bacterium CG_4_9_14_3_um_filter_34_10]